MKLYFELTPPKKTQTHGVGAAEEESDLLHDTLPHLGLKTHQPASWGLMHGRPLQRARTACLSEGAAKMAASSRSRVCFSASSGLSGLHTLHSWKSCRRQAGEGGRQG